MSKKAILIVDDEPAIRRLFASLLTAEGYEVCEAESAEDALALLGGRKIDGFLLDIDMPCSNGIALCRSIRATSGYETAPILFVTGNESRLEEAFAAGCDDLISKPTDRLVLRTRLRGHLQRADFANQLSKIRRMLDRYVSKRTRDVVELAVQTGDQPAPALRQVVVLFTDIRGFTALSDEMEPGALFSLVSAELATQVQLIHQYGGYVDKFGGDGLMAIFDGDDMAVQSCLCALRMVQGARSTAAGDPRIKQLGIGIHLGPAVIGNIGSPEHLDYSAIGSTVNLAARLCGQAAGLTIAVSQAVQAAAKQDRRLTFTVERQAAIRGFKEPVTIFDLLPGSS
jgi:class 3 adenylate cyclase